MGETGDNISLGFSFQRLCTFNLANGIEILARKIHNQNKQMCVETSSV